MDGPLFRFIAALGALAATAQEAPLPIKAAFYDHPINAFGEFGARKPGACGYSAAVTAPTGRSFDVVPGMVADTLPYSREARKKIPARGAVDCNSQNLERWFDPRFAAAASCRDLAFVPARDSAGVLRRRYLRDLFFPIDDMAPPGQLEEPSPAWDSIPDISLPPGYAGLHNFNWCMEINAQFTYRGGETFRFNGDDDVWVYLDERLVVDLGGIHGPNERKVFLDSLPFLAGKRGEAFAFDMYFCERRPAGSYIDVETDLELRPVPFLGLDIALPDGSFPDPRKPMVGKTRLCAMPDYAATDPCGNFRPAPTGKFRPADWSLDGQVIARDSACIDFDPALMPPNRRLILSAKAEGKTSRLEVTALQANLPVSAALKGNGRLEAVSLRLDDRSDSLHGPLRAEFSFAGAARSLESGAARFSARALEWTLAPGEQGPRAVTDLAATSLTTRQAVLGHSVILSAALADSISPAVRSAAWRPEAASGAAGSAMHLEIAPSEALAGPFPAGLQGFAFKAGGRLRALPAAGVVTTALPGGALRITFPAAYPADFRDLDSVSFAAPVADASGNAARAFFAAIDPLAWGQRAGEIIEAAIEKNPSEGRPFIPRPSPRSLVLVDAQGRPLVADAENERLAAAGGPVVRIRSADPLARLELRVYSNLGSWVGTASHAVTDEEWSRAAAGAPGDTCTLRVLWHPVSREGAKVGTGAYVLKGYAITRPGWRAGPGGRWLRVLPARRLLRPIRFGYLRH